MTGKNYRVGSKVMTKEEELGIISSIESDPSSPNELKIHLRGNKKTFSSDEVFGIGDGVYRKANPTDRGVISLFVGKKIVVTRYHSHETFHASPQELTHGQPLQY